MKVMFHIRLLVQICIAPFDRFRTDGQTLQPEQANERSDGSGTKENKKMIL